MDARFPSPAHNGTMWANAFYERNGSTDDRRGGPVGRALSLVDGAVVIGGDPSIFSDGFESGGTSAWSRTVGGI